MKIFRVSGLALLFVIILFINSNTYSQWQSDSKYGFKINIPSSWSKTSYMDGTDKVYDFYSPDENAAIQLRAFKATAGVTIDLLVQIYEQNMLPAGAQRQSLTDQPSANGIPGKQGAYLMNYNGNQVALAAFYTIQNGNGYVLTAIIPTSMLDQKGAEVKAITKSFMLDGFAAPTNKKPSGLSGLMGSSRVSNTNITGKYNLQKRSDGKVLVEYHFIEITKDGTYWEEYSPKNSGGNVSENAGTWKVTGNMLTLTQRYGGVSDSYTIDGSKLIRVSDNGVVFTFRK